MNQYFVTGATGAVGSAIVPRLLDQPATEVTLLMRATGDADLQDRLATLFEFWDIAKDDSKTRRIRALRGDITAEWFGLTPADYQGLASRCTHIIHAAADVHMNRPLAEARKTAVESARHIVSLTRAGLASGQLQKVEFLSTVGVGGRMRRVPEDWLDNEREFHNTYEQSKAEAELYLRDEINAGNLPITVHRPSMVVGDSTTGKVIHYQIFYHLCEFLTGAHTRGLVPRIDQTRLDIIPVDYVADAVVWSSSQTTTIGRILHLCSGPDLSINVEELTRRLEGIWRQQGTLKNELRLIPLWLFKLALPLATRVAPRQRRRAVSNLSLFIDYATDQQVFENTLSHALLHEAGLAIPQPENYLQRVAHNYLLGKSNGGV